MGYASCADLKRIIAAAGSWAGAECAGAFDQLVLSSAAGLVPCDSAVLTVTGRGWRTTRTEPATFLSCSEELTFEAIHRAEPYPLVCRTRESSGGGSAGQPLRLSDLLNREEYHATRLYTELFRALEIEYQIALSVPVASDGVLCLVLNRNEHDFSDREVDCLRQLRVVLAGWAPRVHGGWAARMNGGHGDGRGRAAALTEREGEILGLVAHGLTNAQVARALATSARTVDKHLQHLYRKLGVTSRTEAAAAWAGFEVPGALSPR